MRAYKIGLYEKAMDDSLSWREKMICAKECGYDYMEVCIDASDEKIKRIDMERTERKELVNIMFDIGLPIRSMSVSALTKYALGDPDQKIRDKGVDIITKAIQLAADLGIRTVMIPGYDIYYGESTEETKLLFLENVQMAAEFGAKEGVLLGFETMENEFMNTTKKGMEYVTMVDSPFLKMYPDSGNITNAALLYQQDVCEDLKLGKGSLVSLHLKETRPGVFREVPFLSGHVEFERIIEAAWKNGVRRYVTELWAAGEPGWKEAIQFAHDSMCAILDRQVTS